jgi:hypothetical protein
MNSNRAGKPAKIRWLVLCLIGFATLSLKAAENKGVLLLGIESNNNLTNYQLIFTNVDTDETLLVSQSRIRGRSTGDSREPIFSDAEPGRYFLSAVNIVYDQDLQPVGRLRDTGDYFRVEAGAVNYPGDLIINLDDRRGRHELTVSYEARSATLIAAARGNPELLKAGPIYVAVPGSDRVQIQPAMLGLE